MTSPLRWIAYTLPKVSPWNNPEPVREELFGVERLEAHARSLALAQPVIPSRTRGRQLSRRLADNAAALLDAHRTIAKTLDAGLAITPAAEWLLDNYHLVEARIREVRSDLPPGYYRVLPKLSEGPFAGYPRVFGLAWAFVAHTDSRFDSEILCRYLQAYQEVQPLTIGELWAVAITIRIVLVENLRRLADQIVHDRAARQTADGLADRLLGAGDADAEPVAEVLGSLEHAPLASALAVQLVHRLRDQDPRFTPSLIWLDQRLAAQDTTAEAVVRNEHQRQGASNVTVRNIITSMRLISDVDWADLFERVSLVDDVLAEDSHFADMDFATRNLYRSAIEELSRGSNLTELDVAHAAMLAAATPAAPVSAGDDDIRRRDPGYHLLTAGRRALEATIGFRPPLHTWLGRANRALGIGGYLGATGAATLVLLFLPLFALARMGLGNSWLGLLAALGAIPAFDAAVAVVNRAVAQSFGSIPLPALELRHGIPAHLRTLVAVPTMLTTPDAIARQIQRLEVHYLASRGDNLHFALVSDWVDASAEHAEGDEALVTAAMAGIVRLNRKYGPAPGGDRFLLLHRGRVWSQSEGCFIGWERKRGKLHELNRLLRGANDTTFVDTHQVPPADIRYVVTLDSDTRLPRDTVRRLIGKMAHPLNQPRFDAAAGRVVEGYAVLQPRVTPSLPVEREGSLFQRIFSSMSGIDPYAAAASDVYQDLFGEGSYAGKGIYEIDGFEAALKGRVPESTLLSHDLFEGVFARAGLASDVEVVEEFPAHYDVDAQRHHRWVRGDWQLLPWILGLKETHLPAIGRWKMVDNLRRSVTAPLAVVALLAGWSLPLPAALVWTGFVLATIVLPTLIPIISAIIPNRPGVTVGSHIRALGRDLRLALCLSLLNITLLAHQAWLMVDAIARTLTRLLVTRRHLLEWTTAAQATIGPRLNLPGFTVRMISAPIIGVLAVGVAVTAGHGTWMLGAPLAALWIASPGIALWTSRSPTGDGHPELSYEDERTLRLTARRTWRFFESFVTPADHMLPPDNFQEDPMPVIAHRTSPTNIGLYLLSVASARDFGWIGTVEAVLRLEATLSTMSLLATFRGHFFNWYDTRDLRPLDPQYVSSVDSGNLAGHLIALANACREWREQPGAGGNAGILDALELAREEAEGMRAGRRTQITPWHQLDGALAVLAASLQRGPAEGESRTQHLASLGVQAEAMADIADALAMERGDDSTDELLIWALATRSAIDSQRRDLDAPRSADLAERLTTLEDSARAMALAMEFDFLFDPARKLLSIGYLAPEGTLDQNCYDLLASEARLASFIAIAKDDVPARHWFRLGRAVTPVAWGAALISWSGSMFEYLMPGLVMQTPAASLSAQTSRLIVQRQIAYGKKLGTPWGISESAYNARDLEFTYQ